MAVSYSVKTGQVRRYLRWHDYIISGQGVFEIGQGHLFYFTSQFFQLFYRLFNSLLDFGGETLAEELFGHAYFKALDAGTKIFRDIGNGFVQGRGIKFVVSGNCFKNQGGILDTFGDGSDLIQRRGHRSKPMTRNPPIAGLESDASAKSSRLAYRTARIRTQGEYRQVRGNGCSRTAGRTSRNPL